MPGIEPKASIYKVCSWPFESSPGSIFIFPQCPCQKDKTHGHLSICLLSSKTGALRVRVQGPAIGIGLDAWHFSVLDNSPISK